MSDSKYGIPFWKFILLMLCMVGGTSLIIYSICIMEPLPLLIGSILIAIPITVVLNMLIRIIADIRFERQFHRKQ